MTASNRHTIIIEKVVAGGHGLGRLANGMVVMVPFVLPGETVVVAFGRQHKGYITGTLLDVVEPSSSRKEPLCPHFRCCGGCDFQHADYQSQLAIKADILNELALRAGISVEGVSLEPVLPSPDQFNYRQRIRLQIDSNGQIGFFERRSHAVTEIDVCLLAASQLNQALVEVRRSRAFLSLCSHATSMELLLNPLNGRVVVVVQLRRKPRPADHQAATAMAVGIDVIQSVWLVGDGFAPSGPCCADPFCTHDDCGRIVFALPAGAARRELVMGFEAGGFCQVNLRQNQQLIEQILSWAQVGRDDAVLDLFCGMGNFSLPLALVSRRVVGSDLQRSSIRGAQANASANQVGNCLFLRADALTAAQQLRQSGERFDLVLLDPPRQGCREILSLLPDLCTDKILYISCDPATLVRDLRQLQEVGFTLRYLRGVDMFPQTSHLEAVAMLVRA